MLSLFSGLCLNFFSTFNWTTVHITNLLIDFFADFLHTLLRNFLVFNTFLPLIHSFIYQISFIAKMSSNTQLPRHTTLFRMMNPELFVERTKKVKNSSEKAQRINNKWCEKQYHNVATEINDCCFLTIMCSQISPPALFVTLMFGSSLAYIGKERSSNITTWRLESFVFCLSFLPISSWLL